MWKARHRKYHRRVRRHDHPEDVVSIDGTHSTVTATSASTSNKIVTSYDDSTTSCSTRRDPYGTVVAFTPSSPILKVKAESLKTPTASPKRTREHFIIPESDRLTDANSPVDLAPTREMPWLKVTEFLQSIAGGEQAQPAFSTVQERYLYDLRVGLTSGLAAEEESTCFQIDNITAPAEEESTGANDVATSPHHEGHTSQQHGHLPPAGVRSSQSATEYISATLCNNVPKTLQESIKVSTSTVKHKEVAKITNHNLSQEDTTESEEKMECSQNAKDVKVTDEAACICTHEEMIKLHRGCQPKNLPTSEVDHSEKTNEYLFETSSNQGTTSTTAEEDTEEPATSFHVIHRVSNATEAPLRDYKSSGLTEQDTHDLFLHKKDFTYRKETSKHTMSNARATGVIAIACLLVVSAIVYTRVQWSTRTEVVEQASSIREFFITPYNANVTGSSSIPHLHYNISSHCQRSFMEHSTLSATREQKSLESAKETTQQLSSLKTTAFATSQDICLANDWIFLKSNTSTICQNVEADRMTKGVSGASHEQGNKICANCKIFSSFAFARGTRQRNWGLPHFQQSSNVTTRATGYLSADDISALLIPLHKPSTPKTLFLLGQHL